MDVAPATATELPLADSMRPDVDSPLPFYTTHLSLHHLAVLTAYTHLPFIRTWVLSISLQSTHKSTHPFLKPFKELMWMVERSWKVYLNIDEITDIMRRLSKDSDDSLERMCILVVGVPLDLQILILARFRSPRRGYENFPGPLSDKVFGRLEPHLNINAAAPIHRAESFRASYNHMDDPRGIHKSNPLRSRFLPCPCSRIPAGYVGGVASYLVFGQENGNC